VLDACPVWGTRRRGWAPPRAALTGSRVGFNGLAALELRTLRAHRQSARSHPGKRGIESRSRQPVSPQPSEPPNAAPRYASPCCRNQVTSRRIVVLRSESERDATA
jgi:hypothetical protein